MNAQVLRALNAEDSEQAVWQARGHSALNPSQVTAHKASVSLSMTETDAPKGTRLFYDRNVR